MYEADLRSPHILLKEAVNTATVAKDEINQLVFDASGDFIATADDSGMVSVLEADTLEVMQGIGAHDSLAACVAFTEAGELLSGGYDATIRVRCVHWGKRLGRVQCPATNPTARSSHWAVTLWRAPWMTVSPQQMPMGHPTRL